MSYIAKEIFYTLQGEGAQTGRAAVFLRFSGCNLWSGREEDRAGAACNFCDTDFVGIGPEGGKFETPESLAAAVDGCWPEAAARRKYVVCTGGEPLLQMDGPLIDALKHCGFEIGVETNGTIPAPRGLDWLCVSPKGRATLRQLEADELKLVYPQEDCDPRQFELYPARRHTLQPMDGINYPVNLQRVVEYCLKNPRWRVGLQAHKLMGIR